MPLAPAIGLGRRPQSASVPPPTVHPSNSDTEPGVDRIVALQPVGPAAHPDGSESPAHRRLGWRKRAAVRFMPDSINSCGRVVPQNHSILFLVTTWHYRKTRPSFKELQRAFKGRIWIPRPSWKPPPSP